MKNNWQTKRFEDCLEKVIYTNKIQSNGWEEKTLDQISENLDSKRVPITKNKRKSGIYPYYGASGIVDYVDGYIFDEDLLLVSEDGANLLARSTPIAFSVSGKIWVNNHAHILRFKNMETQKFVEMYFASIKLDEYITGAAQPKLNQSALNSIIISIPPLPEQQRIVAILDEAFAAIATAKENAEKNLQNARELFESYLQSVFANPDDGWDEKTLDQISENLDSKRVPITKNARSSGSYPYYGASGIVDFVDEYIFDDDLLLISEDGANLLARTYPIAFSISGKTWVNNHAHVLRFSNMASQRFVEFYLNSIKLDDYVSGMAQPKLNQKMLNTIVIPYPTLTTQRSIVSKLDALSAETQKLEAIYRQKLADLKELKKSVLQKAFEGEL
ncbi:MAG: restriction endonuclease subunit S [Candidatus Brocadiaceae bacterium]|nr:restriction endonuclease subunit S [Candidatus Brocadiaceae bacterium]